MCWGQAYFVQLHHLTAAATKLSWRMLSPALRGQSTLVRALQHGSTSQGGTATNVLSRYVRRYADDSGKDTLAARFWERSAQMPQRVSLPQRQLP